MARSSFSTNPLLRLFRLNFIRPSSGPHCLVQALLPHLPPVSVSANNIYKFFSLRNGTILTCRSDNATVLLQCFDWVVPKASRPLSQVAAGMRLSYSFGKKFNFFFIVQVRVFHYAASAFKISEFLTSASGLVLFRRFDL